MPIDLSRRLRARLVDRSCGLGRGIVSRGSAGRLGGRARWLSGRGRLEGVRMCRRCWWREDGCTLGDLFLSFFSDPGFSTLGAEVVFILLCSDALEVLVNYLS